MVRSVLPARRDAETFDIIHHGARFSVTLGRFEDGRPAEVFVDGLKTGADLSESLRDAALTLSLALQHGCPMPTIVSAVRRDGAGRPLSVIGAVVDAVQECATP